MWRISRLMKSQFNSTYNKILEDLRQFGRTRYYYWRWIYNILEDIHKDSGDVYPLLVKLMELEKFILRLRDLKNLYYVVGYYSGFVDVSMTLKILEKLNRLAFSNSIRERINILLLAIDIAVLHNLVKEVNELIELFSKEVQKLDDFQQISALSRLGYIISRIDLAYGESIIKEAINFREKLNLTERIIVDAQIAFYLRRAVRGSVEAERLLKESLRLIQEETGLKKTFYLYCRVLPYAYGFAEFYGERVLDDAIKYFKDEFEFYDMLIASAEEIAMLEIPKGAEEILYLVENNLGKSEISGYEKGFIYSKLAYIWGMIDGRRARLVTPVAYHFLVTSFRYLRNEKTFSMIANSIPYLADVDIISAFQILTELFDKLNSYDKIAELTIITKDAFPRDIKGILLRKMLKMLPRSLEDLIHATRAVYALKLSFRDVYLKRVMRVIDKLDVKNKLEKLIDLFSQLYDYDPAYASQLKDYVVESLETIEDEATRADLLLYLAEKIINIDTGEAKRYIANAISVLDKLDYERAYRIYEKASKIVENISGDDYWAEQIRMLLKQEYRGIIKKGKV